MDVGFACAYLATPLRPAHHRRHGLCRRRRQHRRLSRLARCMSGCIAVINAGSSSIKFALYEAGRDGARAVPRPGRGYRRRRRILRSTDADGRGRRRASWPADELDHARRPREILKLGASCLVAARPVLGDRAPRRAWRHRITPRRSASIASVMAALAELVPLAPLHQPHNLAPIAAIARGRAAHPAGRLLRHRVPSQPARARAGLRPAARSHGSRRPPLRLPRPVLRYHRRRGCARSSRTLATRAADHRPSRQRRQPVRRRTTAAASPAPWASPPSTA